MLGNTVYCIRPFPGSTVDIDAARALSTPSGSILRCAKGRELRKLGCLTKAQLQLGDALTTDRNVSEMTCRVYKVATSLLTSGKRFAAELRMSGNSTQPEISGVENTGRRSDGSWQLAPAKDWSLSATWR